MIKRIVKMGFQPEKVETFMEIYKNNRDKIRSFEGCSHVELLQDESDPSIFFTYSVWENEEALHAYRNSEVFSRVWSATKILFNIKPQAWSVKEIQL
jgi:quinol monooxygenase YgiN